MKVLASNSQYNYSNIYVQKYPHQNFSYAGNVFGRNLNNQNKSVSFKGQVLQQVKDYTRYLSVKNYVKKIAKNIKKSVIFS